MEVLEFKLAFARLTPSHREVLVLHAVHGLPYEQVAEICGCEVGTVKSRINRARNLLKANAPGRSRGQACAPRAPDAGQNSAQADICLGAARSGRGRASLTTDAPTSQVGR